MADQFAAVIELLEGGRSDKAGLAVAPIDIEAIGRVRAERLSAASRAVRAAHPVRTDGAARTSVSPKMVSAVFERDGWVCRLCGARTIDLRVLKAVSALIPSDFGFHPNWKFGESHPIYWTHSASLEHAIPLARNAPDEESKFVTSCYACNDARKDLLLSENGWELRPADCSPRRGLTEHLHDLSPPTD